MIFLKTEEEIALMRAANQLVGKTLGEVAKLIKPGVTTNELTRVAEEFIRDNGAEPTFKGYPNQDDVPFPAALCTSVNEMVVHGIPNDEPLKEGDIVSVRERSKSLEIITDSLASRANNYSWLEWDGAAMTGKFLNYPQRADIPENINEQLIVELYSK